MIADSDDHSKDSLRKKKIAGTISCLGSVHSAQTYCNFACRSIKGSVASTDFVVRHCIMLLSVL